VDLRRIRLQARSLAGIQAIGDPMIDETFLNDSINAALLTMSADRAWEWLTTTATVTITAGLGTLPTDIAEATDLHILQPNGLYLRAKRGSFEEVVPTSVGGECLWDVIGSELRLTPANTTALTGRLYYTRAEPRLDSDAQEPLAPDFAHMYLVYMAAKAVKERKAEWQAAEYFGRRADDELDKLRKRPTTGRKIAPVAVKSYADTPSPTYATWN
jgi:hypothetical protein